MAKPRAEQGETQHVFGMVCSRLNESQLLALACDVMREKLFINHMHQNIQPGDWFRTPRISHVLPDAELLFSTSQWLFHAMLTCFFMPLPRVNARHYLNQLLLMCEEEGFKVGVMCELGYCTDHFTKNLQLKHPALHIEHTLFNMHETALHHSVQQIQESHIDCLLSFSSDHSHSYFMHHARHQLGVSYVCHFNKKSV